MTRPTKKSNLFILIQFRKAASYLLNEDRNNEIVVDLLLLEMSQIYREIEIGVLDDDMAYCKG